jgi:beta-phosphoglucomutase
VTASAGKPHDTWDAVIFDLDGVICHTDLYHYRGWKTVADDLGIPFDQSTNNRLRGVSRAESLEVILENYHGEPMSAEEKAELASRKNARYLAFLAELTPDHLDPSVRPTLEVLRARGLKLAIGSSSKNARYILDRIGLDDYFDAISDGNNIRNSKPDPEVFLKAAEYVGVAPERCVVIEDAAAGVMAAHAAGMWAVAVGDAAANGCGDAQITSFADLADILEA